MAALARGGYTHVAIDTEFPGKVVAEDAQGGTDAEWEAAQASVNLTQLIQLGLTFSDPQGHPPRQGPATFQINFAFAVAESYHRVDAIELLRGAGIDFDRLRTHGVDHRHFASLLRESGLLCNPQLAWVCFHPTYDFAYLLRLATGDALRGGLTYDTKQMAQGGPLGFSGGLAGLARLLGGWGEQMRAPRE
eukprot:gene37426-49132_t